MAAIIRVVGLCALVWAGAQTSESEIPFDPADYPPHSLAEVFKESPCSKNAAPEIKDALFSLELVYQGAVRPAPKARFELMRRWTKEVGDPEAVVKYKSEVSFADGKRSLWLSAPEGIVDFMSMDLRSGDRVLLYLVYVGCVQGEPLLAVDEYGGVDQSEEEAEDTII